ncbi:hypothetical protein all7033 [Calothrix sp. PCC 7716]|nr:hypothetical protein all7033 [Calothrix sp. PCC 7716]
MNNYFETAMKFIEVENPNIYTTTGLSRLLLDCRMASSIKNADSFKHQSARDRRIRMMLAGIEPENINLEMLSRVMSDPSGWAIDADTDVQEGAKFYEGMSKIFNADKMVEMTLYHSIRDNIQELQKLKNISCIQEREIEIRGQKLEYQDREDQLTMLDSDYIILESNVSPIVSYYLQVTSGYNIFRTWDNDNETPVTINEVKLITSTAKYAWVYPESIEWEGDVGHYVHKDDPDKITLSTYFEWDGACEERGVYFVAYHPDRSRF